MLELRLRRQVAMSVFSSIHRVLLALFLIGIATPSSAQSTPFEIDPDSAFAKFLVATKDVEKYEGILDGDYLIAPPDPALGYHSTPINALTFSRMGADGVHTAILAVDGKVDDQSPVVYVSPMDSNDLMVLAPSFLEFLADGSGVSSARIATLLDAAESDPAPLLDLLKSRFDTGRMLDEDRLETLGKRYIHLAERKSDCELMKTERTKSLYREMPEWDYESSVREACDGEE